MSVKLTGTSSVGRITLPDGYAVYDTDDLCSTGYRIPKVTVTHSQSDVRRTGIIAKTMTVSGIVVSLQLRTITVRSPWSMACPAVSRRTCHESEATHTIYATCRDRGPCMV